MPDEYELEDERRAAAERLDAGAEVTGDHAVQLAKALIEIADVAGMPASYQATDSRMVLARAVLNRRGELVNEEEAGDDDDL